MKLKKELKDLGHRAKDFLNIHRSQSSSRPSSRQGSNSQNFSSGLDSTDQDIKDEGSTSQRDASSRLDGTNQDTKDLAPPWQGWEPDQEFLYKLHQWNIAHKEDRLPAVLTKVNNALESKPLQAALEFIPDIPFPAKSLVKAMISLFQLGSKIPQTKRDIYKFSNQVAIDITNLAVVFGEAGVGRLTLEAWKDLQETRDLVNEISEWAYNGLKLWNTLSVMVEMKEVKEKLNDARSKFMQIGIIRVFGALDTVMDGIEDLRKLDQIDRRLKSIKEKLGDRVVPQVKYDSKQQKKREYLEGTRERVLNDIEQWACTRSDTENCWWITGRPAVGKSTIGAKVAETFEDEKTLYAQYFISRNIQATTDPENILPTMALQLAENSPLALLAIHDKLETTPLSVVKKFSDGQAQALLLEPLRDIARYTPKVVIVIDGVDELANAEPSVLSKVTSVLCNIMSDLPANVKILIFSRPEQWITAKIPLHIKRLDLATKDSEDDVGRLVLAKLKELAEFHEWNGWPSYDQVRQLCQLAAGHLGLASTALSWITSELKFKGSAWRDEVIEEVSKLGKGEIDELYDFILDSILPPKDPDRKSYLEGLKTVLGCLMVLQEPLDIGSISLMLSLDKFDVLHCMKRISSLIVDGTESVTERTVPKVHKSFVDYLVSDRPHSILHIDPTEQHHSLTTTCFEVIKRLTFNIGHIMKSHYKCRSSTIISQDISYPCQWLGHHLENGGERVTLMEDVDTFMKTRFLQWLEVMSLQELVEAVVVPTLRILENQIKDKDNTLALFIDDAINFVEIFKEPIARSAAHIYISALPLAPSHSLVSQHYLPHYPHTLSVKGGPQTWNEFGKKPVSVNSACISLDGTRIAAVFADGNLCIYDTTGEVFLPPFKIDENPRSVVFSPNGKLVASGGQGLRLWNVQTGEEVESFDIDVYSLAFSPDGACIAAGCGRLPFNMDDSDGGEVMAGGEVRARKDRLASGNFFRANKEVGECKEVRKGTEGSYNIRVINLELAKIPYFYDDGFKPIPWLGFGWSIKLLKGEVRPSPFQGHMNTVCAVAYSADGTKIASSSGGSTVGVWDVSTGLRRTFRTACRNHSVAFSDTTLLNMSVDCCPVRKYDSIIAFSADGKFIALKATSDRSCGIWDTTHRTILNLVGHASGVRSVAFFPDGKQIMSVSEDGTIRVWDIELLERGEMDGWQVYPDWILGPKEEHLFWTPLPFRHTRNTLIKGKCLEIDFSNFVHGDEWVKCREPL